ncbi:MAG: universal stress protein [Terriglobia bacterium]
MAIIQKILFPVDFSPACAAAAPFIRRVADLHSAQLTLLHVIEPFDYSVFELYVRPYPQVEADHRSLAQQRLDSFLKVEFPVEKYSRLLVSGDAATRIAEVAKDQQFDLIAMPTHSGGLFRRTLLGSTVAKVLNDADCPVLTLQHSEAIAHRPVEHREIACSIRMDAEGIRVLRYAGQLAGSVHAHLSVIHIISGSDSDVPVLFDEAPRVRPVEVQEARRLIDELQRSAGTDAEVRIVVGGIKQAIIDSTKRFQIDLLVIGRSPESGAIGRLKDLTYALVRDSVCPVLSL